MRAYLSLRRGRGFSLVELMVSVVVGLLALMFATRLIINAEQNKSVSLGGSDSMQNGMLAMFSISGDAGQAGWGLNDNMLIGCNTGFTDANGYQLATAQLDGVNITPLAPVVIQSNGANSDQISFYSGTSSVAIGSVPLNGAYADGQSTAATAASPTTSYGIEANMVVVFAQETATANSPCTLAELSSALQAGGAVNLDPGLRFNSAAGYGHSFSTPARFFMLGLENKLAFHTWSVQNGILMLRATNLAGSETTPSSVVDNVVAIKAQYGFDTRTAANFIPTGGMQVGQWSSTMIDADGDGHVGGMGDYQRVAAVRLAVIARSKTVEKPSQTSGQCTATTAQPIVFGSAAPAAVAAVPVTVNVAVTGDPIDWK
jgi:type IV pilus assembly protein PilW